MADRRFYPVRRLRIQQAEDPRYRWRRAVTLITSPDIIQAEEVNALGRKYARPPVTEAVCEFRFPHEMPWDLTIPGRLYERAKEAYPKKEQRWVREVIVLIAPEGLREELLVAERGQFSSLDDGCAIQIGTRLCTVNCLRPYAVWNEFRPRIEYAFTEITTISEATAIHTINLRYINTIEIPEENPAFEEYFQFLPVFPADLQQKPSSFMIGCEYSFENDRDACRVELTDAVTEAEGASAYLLNLDYFLAEEGGIPLNAVMDWIDLAHDRLQEIFEACITDTLRGLFGEAAG